jgi:hypothetical protein
MQAAEPPQMVVMARAVYWCDTITRTGFGNKFGRLFLWQKVGLVGDTRPPDLGYSEF